MANVLTTLVGNQAAKYGRRPAFYHREDGGRWIPTSWQTFENQVENAAKALASLGLGERETVAVFSPNNVKILVTDFAAYANRAVPVSIYATSSAEQVEYIVRDSGAKILFAGTAEQYLIARRVAASVESLKQIVVYDDIHLDRADDTTLRFSDFLALGEEASADVAAEVARRRSAALPSDTATLLYTSGTTGEPKGAILTHANFSAALDIHVETLTSLSDSDTSLSFLPLCHIFEKAWTYLCLYIGIRVYVNRDPRDIQESLKEVRPTCMCSVPRFWEKAYATIQDKMTRMSRFNRWLCARALNVGRKRNLHYARLGLKVPFFLEQGYRFYHGRVFKMVKRVMGIENGNIFPTAGAPLSGNIVEFFRSMGVPIVIGYGLSETTATVSFLPYTGYEIGTVGKPLPGLEVKIGEENEILVKGPNVMSGYFNKPAESAAAFTPDGFFRTGDAGYIDQEGAIVLTDRIKDLFKTSNGKYIAPQVLETRLGEDRFIEQVAVIGDQRKYVSALIVPSFEALKEYAAKNNIPCDDVAALVADPRIYDMMERRIGKLQYGLASFEKIKKFTLLPREFTMESGELTNTLKIRRPVINKHYAAEIDAMYS